jgi:DNA-directed RNA polymerase beta' subunit
MGVVQDCLVGAYLMTQGWIPVRKERFGDICTTANISYEKIDHVRKMYENIFPGHGEEYLHTGRGLCSLAFPSTFNYALSTKGLFEKEPILKIRNGVICEGVLSRASIGAKSNTGAVHHYMKPEDALRFLSDIQHIVNIWMLERGFSVGIKDCMAISFDSEGYIPSVKESIHKAFIEANIAENTPQPSAIITEANVCKILNQARDVGQRMAKESFAADNRFLPMIKSGAKGSIDNLTQITGLLGQQIVKGRRLETNCIDQKRTLAHYSNEVSESTDLSKVYEMKGFVSQSFFKGLNPGGFWAHCTAGREGIVETACTTSKTGYCQRRMTKMAEDVIVKGDYTVRNARGRIIQFVYGGDGMSPAKQHRINGGLQFHFMTQIEELNSEYEIECFEQGLNFQSKEEELALLQEEDEVREIDMPTPDSAGSNSPKSIGTPGSVDGDDD